MNAVTSTGNHLSIKDSVNVELILIIISDDFWFSMFSCTFTKRHSCVKSTRI